MSEERENYRRAVLDNLRAGLIPAPTEPSLARCVDEYVMLTYDVLLADVASLAAQLADRNRAYGRASATIGQLRAEKARLLVERAQEHHAVPGFLDGDLLADVLATSAPPEWTVEAARTHAERNLRAVAQAGFRVLRGPAHEVWPAAESEQREEVADPPFAPEMGMILARRGSFGGARKVTSVWPNPDARHGLDVFLDEGRVTAIGPIDLDEWEPVRLAMTPEQLDEVREVSERNAAQQLAELSGKDGAA
ncbi:hypothetical protein [Amycolatopsis sp. NPDC051372]|uniref:hypothetical protein n=1 Tax=Amycolatopsis sp. NPDC051372 TaxID=3155669 RepID=UPI003414E9B3